MPMFRHVGGSVLTERGAIVTIEEVSAFALHCRGEAHTFSMLGRPTLASIYNDLADNAVAAAEQAVDWNRAAAGAPL